MGAITATNPYGRGRSGPYDSPRKGYGLKPSDAQFMAMAKHEADKLGIRIGMVFAAERCRSGMALRARIARARIWRQLKEEGFSYFCIAQAFGFNHTSILWAINHLPIWEEILLEEELEESTDLTSWTW